MAGEHRMALQEITERGRDHGRRYKARHVCHCSASYAVQSLSTGRGLSLEITRARAK